MKNTGSPVRAEIKWSFMSIPMSLRLPLERFTLRWMNFLFSLAPSHTLKMTSYPTSNSAL